MNGNTSSGASRFDPTFTQRVIDAMGPNTSPRMREVMTALIRHLHDFAREIELTVDEWMEGVKLINWAGQMSDDKRNEGQLVCDVVGLESLVDEITYKKASEATDLATQSAILGPFYRTDHPIRKNGETISFNPPDDAEPVYMYGQVFDAVSKKPLANAALDVWECSTNGVSQALHRMPQIPGPLTIFLGLYEQQDPNQVDRNLRGRFITDEEGRYAFYCIRPTPYPVPFDGPAGKLLQLMDRHPYRPAHIHLIVLVEGYKPITTQIFDKKSKYLDNDSVFAVKDSLIVDFVPRKGDDKAQLELHYDINMAPISAKGESGPENGLVTVQTGQGF
ncbi:putative dioxygenase, partial [Aureobasidium melanogenum]